MSWFSGINPFSTPTPPNPQKEQCRAARYEALDKAAIILETHPTTTCEELKGQYKILRSKDVQLRFPWMKCNES
jgi:hypothetical protein